MRAGGLSTTPWNSWRWLSPPFPLEKPQKMLKQIVLLTLETWKEVLEFPSLNRFTLGTLDSPPGVTVEKGPWDIHGG